MLRLHGWKLLLQGLLHSIPQANTFPPDGLMECSHFAPVSLYSLGFVLLLGHEGDPCSLTVEVQSYPSSLCSLTYDIFRALKLLRTVSPHSRSMSTLVEIPSNQSVKRGLWQWLGRPVRHRYLCWMGRMCKEHATLYLRPCLMRPPEAPKGCAQQSQAIQ